MSRFWNQKTRELLPYTAGEQPKDGKRIIKLNTNENPYPPSPKCAEILRSYDISDLRLYPDTDASEVRRAAASVIGVAPENIFVGNGSDEVLALCWQAFFEKSYNTELSVLVPEISYSFYPVYSQCYDVRIRKIPLKKNLDIDVSDYCLEKNCGIAFANPNAPTGLAVSVSDIERIVQSNPDSVVIVDEAYAAFKTRYESAATLTLKYPNLAVVSTLSKAYGLAGLRVGYAVASAELIEGIMKIRDSFNSYPVDRLAQKLAAAALLDVENYEKNRLALINTRTRTTAELRALGFSVTDSSANFLFIKPPDGDAERLCKNLRNKGILVRYFNKPVISEYLRVSIGTDEEMSAFTEAVKEEFRNDRQIRD